jgi:hypothetical protein
MDDLRERLMALETATREQGEELQILNRRLHAARRRARAAMLTALVVVTGILALEASPQARAQFGITLTSLHNRLLVVEAKTAALSDDGTHFAITGRNVHIRDGSGQTDGGTGKGNLTIGYNALRNDGADERTGTHNLILGDGNNHTSFGGLVVGLFNAISADYASVSGGAFNTASGDGASVTGGQFNVASGFIASVSGGAVNTANGNAASVTGGNRNTASGNAASVGGGQNNTAGGPVASVSGGSNRSVSGPDDWRAGGLFQDN